MDDVPILEVYSRERAAHLSAELNLVDGRKLTKEAQSRIKLAHERLAHHYLRKCLWGSLNGSIAFAIRIGQPGKAGGCDCRPRTKPQSGSGPSASALGLRSDPRPIGSFVHVVTSQILETARLLAEAG